MSTTSVRNFSLLAVQGTTVSATPTSQVHTFSKSSADNVMLANNTTTTIFVRTSDSQAVVADANAMPILAGEKGVYAKGKNLANAKYLAYFASAGSADLTILEGSGN